MPARSPFDHPLWSVGFRPLFTFAFVAGAGLPLLWIATFAGWITLPSAGLTPQQWHAHEMFYGFGWAVLGGFLLTASKNWVHVRGLHGAPLAAVCVLWLVERVAVVTLPAGSLAMLVFANAYVAAAGGYVVWTLVRFRHQDTFKDNVFFVVGLPVFLLAKSLVLRPETFVTGYLMTLGLFRLAFAVMFERTITQFMKNAMGTEIFRSPFLDHSIKATVLASAFSPVMPTPAAAVVLALAGALLAVRFFLWKPLTAFRRFDVAVMYVGYAGLAIHLTMESMRSLGLFTGIGTLSLHVFTFTCMGLVVPSMMIRICQGHTGRRPLFTPSDRVALGLMGAGAVLRLVATQIWPSAYTTWIALAGLAWSACFVIVGWRLVPFLWRPRIDGKLH